MVKMNEKAFTLIELLAVIVILAVIALVAVPTVGRIISQNKEKAYQNQIFEIERATEGFVAENISEILPDDTTSAKLSLTLLKERDVVEDKDIINPKDGSKMNGCVTVSMDENGQFHAKYSETPCN